MKNRIALSAFLALAAVAGALPAAAQDKIIWRGERTPTDGTVTSLNFREIKYRMVGAGPEQEDNAREVKDIEFDSENSLIPYYEYNQGRNALHKGNFKEAIDQFSRAIDRLKSSNTPNHPIRDFCRRHILEATLASGDAQAVVTAARDLRKEKPDSFFLRDSFLIQFDAAKMRRDVPLQEATIKEIEDLVKSDRKYADVLQRDVDLLKADLLESSKQYEKALSIYTRLGADRDLWEAVSLGTLRCLSALGRTADLKIKVESILTELKGQRDSSPRVYLGAIIARGDVLLAEGKIKDALLDYMKAALDPGPSGNSYEHETSLAKAGIAASKYAKQFGEADKQNKVLYIDRAKELREELKRTYPATGWLADVDAAIKDAERSQ